MPTRNSAHKNATSSQASKGSAAHIRTYAKMIYSQTGSVTRASRFVIRSLFKKPTTLRWLNFIETQPFLSTTPATVRRVLGDKIHRAFARRGITTAERVDMLITHYEIMGATLPARVLADMVTGQRFPLATMQGKRGEGTQYVLTLSREMISEHQGELVILFMEAETNIMLARLMFNLSRDKKDQQVLIISGLQGPDPEHKPKIVNATRDLDGLRPKQAVLETACAIARWMQASSIVAICKNNHVSQSKKKWQRKVKADYDSFWEEFTSVRQPNGDYQMPLSLPRREAADVPSKRRKAWTARMARIDALGNEVAASMTTLKNMQ